MAASPAAGKGAAGSEEKLPTQPAQSLPQKDIGERQAAAEVAAVSAAAAARATSAPISMAASAAPDKLAAGSEEKGPTPPAGGGIPRPIRLVVMALVAVVVPTLMLVRFNGHPMSQVWIVSLSICSFVFCFLLSIWRSRWFYTEFVRLSYGPMLAFCSASAIGSATAVFVLFFSMVWAAGNLGYSLAAHRLRKGTELAIHALPMPSRPTDSVKELNLTLYTSAPFTVLVWTLVMAFFLYVATMTDELDILMFLSYFGWIHAAFWLFILTEGFPVRDEELMVWSVSALFPWMIISPALCLISQILAVLCHLLLILALVALLWYDLAVYMHYLETATPSTTTLANEDTLQSEIQQDNIGQVKPDRTLGETSNEICSYSTAV